MGAVTLASHQPDIAAVCGAFFAAWLVWLTAVGGGQRRWRQVFLVSASGIVGSIAPGAAMYFEWPEEVEHLTWHAWAAMGFIAGIIAPAAVLALLKVASRRLPDAIDRLADRAHLPKSDTDSLTPEQITDLRKMRESNAAGKKASPKPGAHIDGADR